MKWLNCEKMKVMLIVFVAMIVLDGGNAKADFTFGEPTNLGPPVNSTSADCFDCLSADGLEIYIDRGDGSTNWLYNIWVAKRPTIDDDWGEPVKLGSNINTPDHDDGYASISPDGLELYFDRGNNSSDYDLYVANRETTNDEWLPAVKLGNVVNSSASERSASISGDGLSLYFYSDRSGGEGDYDLYVTTRQSKNQSWSMPVNLGPLVNSSSVDYRPSISSDGLALIFSSNRPGKYSSGNLPDLWLTTRRTTSDPWQEPINLGPMINTDDVDLADISQDGCTLYLSCYFREGGYGWYDIYQAPIIPIVDFNGDGNVDVLDLGMLIINWGSNDTLCDIGPMPWGDGIVDVQDLKVLIKYWQPEILPPELVAYWRLDENEGTIAYDCADFHDGTWYGEPFGESGQESVPFDGIDDYVSTPFVLNPAGGEFSVFAWVMGGIPGQVIISQAGGADLLAVDPSDGCLMSELQRLRGASTLLSQTVITDLNWHSIGLVWDGSERILYVDDVVVARDTLSGLIGSMGGLCIGAGKNLEPSSFFSGLIKDVRIYNQAITP